MYFQNDPFATVFQVFQRLYPAAECDVIWTEQLRDEEGGVVYGMTTFHDGDDEIPLVEISAELTVQDAVEILAHELAHVAVGVGAGHGPKWEKAFKKIHEEYLNMMEE